MLPEPPAPPAVSTPLDPFLSQKLRFWSLVAMLCLVYVHAFNLHPRYLQPWTRVEEPFTLSTGLQYLLANGLLRFRIPLLFAISGYLLARRDGHEPHRQRLRRRLRTLGLPYLLWSGLWLLVVAGLEQFAASRTLIEQAQLSPFWPRQLLSQYQPLEVVVRWLLLPVPFQLWFLRSLLVYNLAYPWLRSAVLGRPALYFSLAGLLWFFMVPLWPLAEGEGLLFFGLGLWLALRGRDVLTPPGWFRPGPFAAAWVGAAALKTALAFQNVEHGPLLLPLMLLLHRVGEVSGLLTAWFCLDGLVRRSMAQGWFRWLTGFSFIIYVLHVPAINYLTELLLRHAPASLPQLSLLTYLGAPLLVIAGSVAVGAALRRLVPGPYAVLTGGRGLAAS